MAGAERMDKDHDGNDGRKYGSAFYFYFIFLYLAGDKRDDAHISTFFFFFSEDSRVRQECVPGEISWRGMKNVKQAVLLGIEIIAHGYSGATRQSEAWDCKL